MLLKPGAHRHDEGGGRAFTLIELLVCISIIGLLVALLLPSLRHARLVAQDAKCMANLKSHGIALTSYATDNIAYYPRFGDMTDECLRDLSCIEPTAPTNQSRGILYVPVAPYHNQWNGLKNVPATPLFTGQYLSAGNALGYQCPGNMRYANSSGFGTANVNRLWGDASFQQNIFPRYSYCYLAGIPHEGWDKNSNPIMAGGDRSSWTGSPFNASMVMRFNTMRGVDRRWVPRPLGTGPNYTNGAPPNMPYTMALMTDTTVWDNSTFDWQSHYWVNHSKFDQFFPNPINKTLPQDQDLSGYADLAAVCRSSNTVFADGHVIVRYPDAGQSFWSLNVAIEPDTGDKLPMVYHYGVNVTNLFVFYRYYW